MKLHFDDLTAITAPFGLLDEDTQRRLKEAGPWDFLNCDGMWEGIEKPTWLLDLTYRKCPEPETDDYIDWSHVAPQFVCMARDESEYSYLHSAEPQALGCLWDGEGDVAAVKPHASYRRGNKPWNRSLVWRPGHGPKGGAE